MGGEGGVMVTTQSLHTPPHNELAYPLPSTQYPLGMTGARGQRARTASGSCMTISFCHHLHFITRNIFTERWTSNHIGMFNKSHFWLFILYDYYRCNISLTI